MAKTPSADTAAPDTTHGEYRVLARKYRPQNFAELKGQDALVRTLTNAIESGRIAHAFMLTGVRGVGKTTTARIIARALNCVEGPTVTPCGVCDQCVSIAQDRNMDVLEVDAASRTGVDDVREIIDSVQYAPTSARYKVFIIDEVHMLSKAAFNALLKTLEEPPAHVKFVFATTEIRKVPVTVLSRCQRFDLKRIGADVLGEYFTTLVAKEGVTAEAEAISLIARAADGSARDGLSLLDQAISRSAGGHVLAEDIRTMLGLADRARTVDLFEAIVAGDSAKALEQLDTLYSVGADPVMVLQDLLELTHFLTKLKVSPELANDPGVPETERVRGTALAKGLSVPVLTRSWQMLLKGVSEVQQALTPQLALEMIIIRLLYVSDQPTPGDAMKQLKDGSFAPAGAGAPMGNGGGAGAGLPRAQLRSVAGGGANVAAVATQAVAQPEQTQQTAVALNSFEDIVALAGQKREALLQSSLINDVHLVAFAPGHLSIRLRDGAAQTLVGQLSNKLSQWTGERWMVSLSREQGQPTIGQMRRADKDNERATVLAHPVVAEVMRVFPDASIASIDNEQ